MKYDELIAVLDAEWELPNGFFASLREGRFSKEKAEKIISALSELRLEAELVVAP